MYVGLSVKIVMNNPTCMVLAVVLQPAMRAIASNARAKKNALRMMVTLTPMFVVRAFYSV